MREYRPETFFFERGKRRMSTFLKMKGKSWKVSERAEGEKENSVQKDTEEYTGKWKAESKKEKTGRGDSKKKCNRSENRLHA